MGLHLSSTQLSLSFSGKYSCEAVSPLPCYRFLPLQGLGCTLRLLQLVMLGAPSVGPWCPRMLAPLEPRTFLARVYVCCSQGKRREAVQNSCALQCRVEVPCQPSTGELHILHELASDPESRTRALCKAQHSEGLVYALHPT